MLVTRTYRGLTALLALSAASGIGLTSGCSDAFTDCHDTHTCPRTGGTGGAGAEGGAGADASDGGTGAVSAAGAPDGTVGGTGPAAAGAGGTGDLGGMGGMGDTEPSGKLGKACDESGALACNGPAQKLSLICKNGVWAEREVCKSDENCDEASGVCASIVEACAGKRGGELYCAEEQALYRCGPDLVSTELVEECEGACLAAAGSASCVPPGCGDSLVQNDEACDDGNMASGDGCSAACQVEPIQLVAAGGIFESGAAPSSNICALGSNGKIRCFKPGQTDWAWADIPLAASEKAVAISGNGSIEISSLCALLEGGAVRCWGFNDAGDLGLGDTAPRTFAHASANVDLGPNQVASSIAVGGTHACAVVNNGTVKCWGRNSSQQLGYAPAVDNDDIGDAPGEMGANLATVPTATSGQAVSLALGPFHSCALRGDKTLRCWGTEGRYGDTSGAQFSSVSTSETHNCGVLTSGALKCWGVDNFGQLGLGSNSNDLVPLQTAQPVQLGAGRKAKSVTLGRFHTCAILDNGSVKCWGYNNNGELGAGHKELIGDKAGDMAALQPINLGSGRKAKQLAIGLETFCALLDDGQVTCWGKVNLPAPAVLGDGPNEMGSKLPIVPLQF
jgi:cysteine-rich repeat protein